jgi:hypothetical protein
MGCCVRRSPIFRPSSDQIALGAHVFRDRNQVPRILGLLVQPMLVSIQYGLTKASNAPLTRWRQFDQASRRQNACVLSYVRHRR